MNMRINRTFNRPRVTVRLSTASCLLLLCAACATTGPKPTAAALASAATRPATCDAARDRAAILSMAGTFDVSFAFDETEALSPGYELAPEYRAEATEVVSVLESSERRVVLQHILLIEKHSGAREAMKHWRQDWTFEDRDLLEFRGSRTFAHRSLSEAEARCTWTQAVFEVDEGPRYESYGFFQHEDARSTWVSQQTWRPLPRREYTRHNDYDVILGTNTHVITPSGWQHVQDNLKLVLAGQKQLARERGLNEYRRVESPSTALAEQYLAKTSRFWSDVRAEWATELQRGPQLVVQQEVSGKPLYDHLFPLAEQAGDSDERARIHELVGSYVEVASQPSAAISSAARE